MHLPAAVNGTEDGTCGGPVLLRALARRRPPPLAHAP